VLENSISRSSNEKASRKLDCSISPRLRIKLGARSADRDEKARNDERRQGGAMDTTGMSTTKGNIKRDSDGAPSKKDEKK
jgi:hypothetical protein